ncbi:MAG: cupin domain-containing protein [Acidobacteria bacterium]|nr:cupin domain-containing protein [Acidobacteriota bacterium]
MIRNISGLAEFNEAKMGKVQLAAGQHLYAGMNCFLPGQEHAAHVHPDQDKLYYILAGTALAEVDGSVTEVFAGDLVLAPAGVPHGLKNPGPEPLSVLVIFGPPPRR